MTITMGTHKSRSLHPMPRNRFPEGWLSPNGPSLLHLVPKATPNVVPDVLPPLPKEYTDDPSSCTHVRPWRTASARRGCAIARSEMHPQVDGCNPCHSI